MVFVGTSGFCAGVRLVDNHEVGTMVEEDVALVVLLHIVNGNHLEGNVAEYVLVGTQFFLQAADGRRTDDFSFQAKLVLDFILPLFAKMGQAYHRKAIDFMTVEQFFGNQQRLQGFSNPHVVRDEQTNSFLLERENQRHDLVWARFERKLSQALERSCNVAERQAACVVKHLCRCLITVFADVVGGRTAKIVGTNLQLIPIEGKIEADGLGISPSQWLYNHKMVFARLLDNPRAIPEFYQCACLIVHFVYFTGVKMSGYLPMKSASGVA